MFLDIKRDDQDITLDIDYELCIENGKYNGLPENCYPSIYSFEILSAKDEDGKDWISYLNDSEKESIEELANKCFSQNESFENFDNYNDVDDSFYERFRNYPEF